MASPRSLKMAGFAILLVCSFVFVFRGLHDMHKSTAPAGDFQTVYGMTRCMLENCDPYDSDQIRMAFERNGGVAKDTTPFRPHEPLYLPSALLVTVPFALLPWGPAHVLWLVAILGSFLAATFLMASLCSGWSPGLSVGLLGLLVLTSLTPVTLAQPALFTIGLAGIAVWCFLERKAEWFGVCCMAVSLAYKPHVSGLVWLYFLLAGGVYRRRAVQVFAVTMAIAVPGFLWATLMPGSAHWMTEMPANVAAITGRGNVADPGPQNVGHIGAPGSEGFLNLQAVAATFRDEPHFYNNAAHAMGAALLLVWLYPVVRMRAGREKDLLAIASVACISLLPLYHPEYDSRLLMLTFPAFALAVSGSRWRRLGMGATVFGALVLLSNKYQAVMFRYVVYPRLPLGVWGTIFWMRELPLVVLGLAGLYLWLFYKAMGTAGSGVAAMRARA